MKLLALLCLLVLAVDGNAAEALRTIPNAFQGVWAASEQHCSPGGESRLRISENGQTLTEVTGRRRGLVRSRCEASEPIDP